MDAFVIKTKRTAQSTEKNSSLKRRQSYQSSSWLSSSTSSQSNYINATSSDVGALNKLKPDRGQRRISDLDGVVVLEKIEKYVKKLSDPNVASVAKVKRFTYFN